MKQTKMMKRVFLVVLTLVLLVATLTSCGSGSTKLDTVKKAGDGEGCKVYFTRILKLTGAEAAREAFVAASNGYNMLAEGFDDSKVGTAEDPKDPAAVTYEKDGVIYTVSMDGAKAAINLLKPQTDSVGDIGVFDQEDPLEKEMATHSSILAWEIPCLEEPGGLQCMQVAKSQTQLSDFHFHPNI